MYHHIEKINHTAVYVPFRRIDHSVSYLLYMIMHDLSIHIAPYLIRPYDQAITNIYFELSDDTMFDMIGPVFLLQKLGWKQANLYMIQWQPRFCNHSEVGRLLPFSDLCLYVSDKVLYVTGWYCAHQSCGLIWLVDHDIWAHQYALYSQQFILFAFVKENHSVTK